MNQKYLGQGYLICNLYDHNYLEFFIGTREDALKFIETVKNKTGDSLVIKGDSISYYVPEQQNVDEYGPPEWLPDNKYLGC
jgi:hypothetical protein